MTACTDCKHDHTGPEFGGICIGCSCQAKLLDVEAPAPPPLVRCGRCRAHAGTPTMLEALTNAGWLHHVGPTLGGGSVDVWVCPQCRLLAHIDAPVDADFECDVCDADEPCDGCWGAA